MPQPRLGRLDLVIGSVLAMATVLVAWQWRAAIVPIDPWDYVEGALNFPNGVWNEVGLSRWAMLAPLMVAGRAWGDAEATYYVYPILSGGLLAAVLYGLAARLVNRWTGIAGSVLVCSTAVVLVHLSRGYPDLIATAFVGLALLSLLLARDQLSPDAGEGLPPGGVHPDAPAAQAPAAEAPSARPMLPSPHRERAPGTLVEVVAHTEAQVPPARGSVTAGLLWVLLAGGSVGWAFEVRELSALAWPALAVALLRVGRQGVVLPTFVALPLVALVLDTYLSWRVYGDPLLKVRSLTGNSIASSEVAADATYLGEDRLYYMTIPFRVLWDRSAGPALVLAMGVGLIGGAVLARRLGPLWLWGASVLGLLWLAGGAVRPATPSIRLDIVRYNLAYAVPLSLTAVCVLALGILSLRGWRRASVVLGAAALALASVIPTARFAATFEGLAPNGGDALREMGTFLESYPDLDTVRIWSDWATQRVIPVYSVGPFGGVRWEAKNVRSLNRLLRTPAQPPRRQPRAGDLVVLYSQDDQTCYHCHEALAEVEAVYGRLPLAGWQEVFRSSTGNLVVYRVPEDASWPYVDPAGLGGSAAPDEEASVGPEGRE